MVVSSHLGERADGHQDRAQASPIGAIVGDRGLQVDSAGTDSAHTM